MKKYLSLMLALLLCLSLCACGSSSEEAKSEESATTAVEETVAPAEEATAVEETAEEPVEEPETVDSYVTVYVTISDAGTLRVVNVPFTVLDVNNDGAVPVNAAIAAAHDTYYDGGAEEGFTFEETEFGMSITKLWGVENGGSYGYYVNNEYVLPDYELVEGDYICVYSYTDLTNWSDCYSYFDCESVEVAEGEEVSLCLSMLYYDEDWTLQTKPVEGAEIIINGEISELVTDAEGKLAVADLAAGDYLITAVGPEGTTLVPPVCIVTVK